MNEPFSAWRSREGTVLLAFYGTLIALVSGAFALVGAPVRAAGSAPSWIGLLPVAVPLLLLTAVTLVRPLRALAYRLQLVSVGTFLLALVALFLNGRYTSGSLLLVVVCMFGVQYAFMRWQELVAAYASALVLFAVFAAQHGVLLHTDTKYTFGVLFAVCAVCVGMGSLRLRSMYTVAFERFRLEVQTAELRRQTERNARMACTDPLTGLLNRSGMNDLIDRALALSERSGAGTAMLYVDLDGFKAVNDMCGHDAGDLVLVEAALRIQYLLRTGESAGRIGGDEFVVVLPSVQSIDEGFALAKRIEEAFAEPFTVANRAFSLSASIGVTISSDRNRTRLDLLSAADKAMYGVKRRRKFARSKGQLLGEVGFEPTRVLPGRF